MGKAKIPAGCLVGSRFLEGKIPDPLKHGARAVRFIENLKHTEGSDAGQPFKLHPWQSRIVRKKPSATRTAPAGERSGPSFCCCLAATAKRRW